MAIGTVILGGPGVVVEGAAPGRYVPISLSDRGHMDMLSGASNAMNTPSGPGKKGKAKSKAPTKKKAPVAKKTGALSKPGAKRTLGKAAGAFKRGSSY